MFSFEGIDFVPKLGHDSRAVLRWAKTFDFIARQEYPKRKYLRVGIVHLFQPFESLVARKLLEMGQFVHDPNWRYHNGDVDKRIEDLNNWRTADEAIIISDAHFAALAIIRAAAREDPG